MIADLAVLSFQYYNLSDLFWLVFL